MFGQYTQGQFYLSSSLRTQIKMFVGCLSLFKLIKKKDSYEKEFFL